MKTVALVPAKALDAAKSRLSGVLDEAGRAALALDMLEAVLAQLVRVSGIDSLAVVTGDPRAEQLAARFGAAAVKESNPGLNLGLESGRAWAIRQDAESLLVVLSDLPLVQAVDVEAVVEAAAPVVIAPSQDGGTNALRLRPPMAIPFRFGRNSASYHRFEAEKRGIEVSYVRRDSLRFDVDTPDDLARYQAARQRALARP